MLGSTTGTVIAILAATYTAVLAWASGLTKLAWTHKGQIALIDDRVVKVERGLIEATTAIIHSKVKVEVLDERTVKLDRCVIEVKDALIRSDAKLDRLIGHMLDQQSERK